MNEITYHEARAKFLYLPETGEVLWRATANRAGTQAKGGRRSVGGLLKMTREHRLIWLYQTGGWPEKDIDHVNGDPSDNRWQNLREATHQQNQWNKGVRKDNRHGFVGVSYHKGRGGRERIRPWSATIKIAGKNKSLGYFKTAEEAGSAYERAAKELYGNWLRRETLVGVSADAQKQDAPDCG